MIRSLITRGIALIVLVFSLTVPEAVAQQEAVKGEITEVNGLQLHYRMHGNGPPLLLLHGFTGSSAWWSSMVDELAKKYTVIAPDLPGHGHSGMREGAYRYASVSSDLFALMGELGYANFRALGYSAGGIILFHMATQQPERIDAMALISAVHVMPDAVRPALEGWPSFEENPPHVQEYWLDIHPGGQSQMDELIGKLREIGNVPDNMSFSTAALGTI